MVEKLKHAKFLHSKWLIILSKWVTKTAEYVSLFSWQNKGLVA